MVRPRVLVFDVNETLLDLTALRVVLAKALGGGEQLAEWFFRLLHGSLVANTTDAFRSFETIGAESLAAVAQKQGLELATHQQEELIAEFRSLPPHSDVPAALARLADSYRLIALSNGSPEGIETQLTSAGIVDHFAMIVSVEEVGRFKPHPAPYRHALKRLDIGASDALMVAAHDWDIAGAATVGMPGAFIRRPGVVWSLPTALPQIVVADTSELADLLAP